jgi:protocatechuate 3,4-dioxygenase beta subunit
MSRTIAWISPALCLLALSLIALCGGRIVRADDMPATQPSDSAATTQPSGSIVVTVVDGSSSPIAKARVALYQFPATAEGDDASAHPRPKRIARATTDDDGKHTFDDVANGEYRVTASLKGSKRASTKVSVTDQSANPSITITLVSDTDNGSSGGGATTAPSSTAAPQ